MYVVRCTWTLYSPSLRPSDREKNPLLNASKTILSVRPTRRVRIPGNGRETLGKIRSYIYIFFLPSHPPSSKISETTRGHGKNDDDDDIFVLCTGWAFSLIPLIRHGRDVVGGGVFFFFFESEKPRVRYA